ncbi:MAG: SDR family NAD(P)-dependent oxidoreductase [Oceanococcaceae bacterium]
MHTILITGASSGFGAACARRFAQDGARLILLARSADALSRLADDVTTQAADVHIEVADMRDRDAIATLPARLPAGFRDVDLLVNNAGLALGIHPAQSADLDDWETMVDTNIKGLMRMTRAILPGMVERNRGHIINIGSTAASWPYPGGNAYGGTKAFVAQFTRNLKADLIGTAVRVSNIEPGMADTNFSKTRFKGDAQKADAVYAGTQSLTAEDVADTVHWIAHRPAHVNINTVEIMPTCQAWAGWAVARDD